MARRRNAPESPPQRAHLRLDEFSDRELLLALDDAADEEGFATSREIAAHVGLPGADPHRSVACRLSWLVRFGAVTREIARDEAGNIRVRRSGEVVHTQRWTMTEIGRALAFGSLRQRDLTALDRLDDAALLDLTSYVAGRSGGADPTTAKLVTREWKYGMTPSTHLHR